MRPATLGVGADPRHELPQKHPKTHARRTKERREDQRNTQPGQAHSVQKIGSLCTPKNKREKMLKSFPKPLDKNAKPRYNIHSNAKPR